MYANRVGELLQLFKTTVPLAQFGIELVNDVNASKRGGFLALKAKNAVLWHQKLHEKGVFTDARGTILRFGPAPYTTTEHIHKVTDVFNHIIEENP
jgi:kynureninase